MFELALASAMAKGYVERVQTAEGPKYRLTKKGLKYANDLKGKGPN